MTARTMTPGKRALFAVPSESCGPHAIPTLPLLVAEFDTLFDELMEEIAHLEEFGGTHEAVEQLRIVALKQNRKFVCIMDVVRSELEARR